MTIEERLSQLFPEGKWILNKSFAGESDKTFVASNGKRKLFIKYTNKAQAIRRLSELGVTPKMTYDGTNEQPPYLIQDYIEGKYPDRKWFADNIQLLAVYIKKYQGDAKLRDELSNGKAESYADHIKQEIAILEEAIASCHADVFATEEVHNGIALLKEKSKQLKPVLLVPTHADPNTKNFLLTNNGIIMVDWDDIMLSDPMKDAGLMLWWYVHKNKWPEFFEAYGEVIDEEKIFWWTSKASLQIATWFAKRKDNDNAQFFIRDFLDALHGKNNSQMYINDPNS
jgi:hypothetical protein